MRQFITAGVCALTAVSAASAVQAATFGGIEFPAGEVSFADVALNYDPLFSGGNPPQAVSQDTNGALGAPNYDGAANGSYLTLGSGGRVTLQFTDNALTGSGDATPDLHVFEVGLDVEDTFVEVSADGTTFTPVGKIFGATSSIDIDAFGFDTSASLLFVRLTDDPAEGESAGLTPGADIDAVGAISTIAVDPPNAIPLPPAVWMGLVTLGLAGAGHAVRLRRRPW